MTEKTALIEGRYNAQVKSSTIFSRSVLPEISLTYPTRKLHNSSCRLIHSTQQFFSTLVCFPHVGPKFTYEFGYSTYIMFLARLTEWLIEYNFNRPHQSPGYLAPVEYIERELAKIHSLVLPMWSASTSY